MKAALEKARPEEFEPFGFETRIVCGNRQDAIQQCGLHLNAYEERLQPTIRECGIQATDAKHKHAALRASIYERPIPLSDAKMLSLQRHIVVTCVFATLAVLGCLQANVAMFMLVGAGLGSLFLALGLTIFPVVAGHLAFELILSRSKRIIKLVALSIVLLIGAGFVKIGIGRRDLTSRALTAQAPSSYVEDDQEDIAGTNHEPGPEQNAESSTKNALSDGAFFLIIATELAAGVFIGQIVHWVTGEDYFVWKNVNKLAELIATLEKKTLELTSLPELAKKYCMAGILRAESSRPKPRPPYFRALSLLLVGVLILGLPGWAQTIEHYQGILIDSSASISRAGNTSQLFDRYLLATKDLLLREPPNSHVWISTISTDSFGGSQVILKGWTPESHGVFADDLNRSRRQLASAFEAKSSAMSPVASGTDILGALWRFKALAESHEDGRTASTKDLWIFSDMMHETKEFSMPELLTLGSRQMLQKAGAERLLVPLKGYTVHVCGASTSGMSPREWRAVQEFWKAYFAAAGAELNTYSTEPECNR
jgi:hypothetical protein